MSSGVRAGRSRRQPSRVEAYPDQVFSVDTDQRFHLRRTDRPHPVLYGWQLGSHQGPGGPRGIATSYEQGRLLAVAFGVLEGQIRCDAVSPTVGGGYQEVVGCDISSSNL